MGLEFLDQISTEFDQMGKEIERLLFKEPQAVLSKTRIVAEELAKYLNQQEDIKEVYDVKQVDRIHKLERKGVIEVAQKEKFDWLRREGNKAAHQSNYGSVELAIQAHRHLYDLTGWYVECYGETDFKLPPYELPRVQDSGGVAASDIEQVMGQLIDEKMAPLLQQFMEKINQTKPQTVDQTTQSETAATAEGVQPVKEQTATPEVKKPIKKSTSQTKVMLGDYLTKHLGYNIIDKRDKQGTLWVIGGWELSDQLLALKENKIFFRFASKGSNTTKGSPAWFLVNKRSASKLFVMVDGEESTDLPEKPVPEDTTPQENSGFELVDYFISKGFEVVDKRATGGPFWVIGGWDLEPEFSILKKHKIYFRFTKKGGKATNHQPAWFLLNKTKDPLYINIENETANVDKVSVSKEIHAENTSILNTPESNVEVDVVKKEEPVAVSLTNEPSKDLPKKWCNIKKPLPSYQVSDWNMPLPEKEMNEVISNNKVGQELLFRTDHQSFTDLKIEDLRNYYKSDQNLFYGLVQFMTVMSIRFEGPLNHFAPFSIDDQLGFIEVINLTLDLKDICSLVHREQLAAYGIMEISQLNGLSISAIQFLFKDIDNNPLQFLERSVETNKTENDSVVFRVFEEEFYVPNDALDTRLSSDVFNGVNLIIRHLNKSGYELVKDLPLDLSFIQKQYKGVGLGALRKFVQQFAQFSEMNFIQEIVLEENTLYYNQKEVFKLDDVSKTLLLRNMSFQSVNVVLDGLDNLEIKKVGDLPQRLEELQKINRVGATAVKKFVDQLGDELNRQREKRDFENLPFDTRLKLEVEKSKQLLKNEDKLLNPRDKEILFNRFKRIQENKPATLEALGGEYGVTRERIRQIKKKSLFKVSNKINGLIQLMEQTLEKQEYVENDWFNLKLFEDHLILEALDETASIYVDQDGNVFTKKKQADRESEKKEIVSEAKNAFRGLEASLSDIYKWFAEQTNWPLGKIEGVATQLFTQAQTEKRGYILVSSTKLELAEIILRKYPHGVEVYKRSEELNELGNQLVQRAFESKRDFAALCNRDEAVDRLLLWGRGIYIHRDHIRVPNQLINEIEKDILERFKTQDELQIRIVFEKFEERLLSEEVPTEYALYTLLRLFGSGSFYLPKYPLITKEEVDFQYNVDRIENMIRNQGGRITYQELFDEFILKQGWKEYTLQLNLSNGPFVVEQRGVYVLLSQYDYIQPAALQPIYQTINQSLETNDFVLILRIFQDHQVLAKQLGIHSARLLYVLLSERNKDESIVYNRYPYVLRATANVEQLTKATLIEGYALEEQREIPREELIDFVEGLGGIASYVDHVLSRSNDLFYYTRGKYGEYIHRQTIQWTDDKEKELKDRIQESFDHTDLPYLNLEELYQHIQKPSLANNIPWTEDLFSNLVLRMNDFIEIGSMHKLMACKKKLNSDAEFITYLISEVHGGTVKKHVLEDQLRELGFNSGRLSFEANEQMERGDTPFVLQGDEFILREWVKG